MYLFSLFIQPLAIDELQASCALYFNVWCADDEMLIGRIPKHFKATSTLKDAVLSVGYHAEVNNPKLWWSTADHTKLWRFKTNLLDDRVLLKLL